MTIRSLNAEIPGGTEAAFADAVARLVGEDPVLAEAHRLAGWRPPVPRPAGLQGLVRIICFQQISTAAGLSIWNRVAAHIGAFDPDTILRCSEANLRACGLSRPKIAHIRSVAGAVADGRLDFDRIAGADDEAARAELVAVKGIGPWSADIYLMFGLMRMDAFPAGDMALQEVYRRLTGGSERPGDKAFGGIAEAWRPHRAVAAHLLWGVLAGGGGAESEAW